MPSSKKGSAKPAARKSAAKKAPAKKAPAKKAAAKKAAKPRGGIAMLVTPDAEVGAIVGTKPLTRADLTKKIWAYIKANGLQDSKNKRNINADAKLKPVFGGKAQVSMFEMTKLVSKHVK
ncbi:MAG: SWIB/MDM2 domain-containing protein [Nevskia sp.]|nr:SWIB/MDM2 domain-containing protein [Nevskia sp.]